MWRYGLLWTLVLLTSVVLQIVSDAFYKTWDRNLKWLLLKKVGYIQCVVSKHIFWKVKWKENVAQVTEIIIIVNKRLKEFHFLNWIDLGWWSWISQQCCFLLATLNVDAWWMTWTGLLRVSEIFFLLNCISLKCQWTSVYVSSTKLCWPPFCVVLTDGLQVLVMAALSSVRLLRHLQFIVRRAQRLVLLGTQHALWLLVNLW